MSKRKRTTADEKRSLMLRFFHDKKEFFTLKELETMVPKECGFNQQSVKDVLQSLVDDGQVHSDKIGTIIYFWSFPGETLPRLQNVMIENGKKILNLERKQEKFKSDIQKQDENKEGLEKTRAVMKEIEVLQGKEEELRKQISKFSDADPEVIAEINKNVKFYKDGANTWTDNMFSLKTWCNNKFNIEEKELNKQFKIPEDLDYID